ncbi:MAG: DUF896 domain-containing protein [Oscillospiraceae bacterium]
MTDEKIKRINELAKKAREVGLTEDELALQKKLRQEYIDSFKKSLTDTLEHTYIIDEKGNKVKVSKKTN